MTNKICLACKSSFHDECQTMWDGELGDDQFCCCEGLFSLEETPSETFSAAIKALEPEAYFDDYTGSKDLTAYADPLSTGRKEAVKKFPIKPGMVCEWAWLQYAGGGVIPIIGCPGHPAEAVHHGPDKNTMRNTAENVHRICAECHNRWHAANDEYYGERPTTPDGKVDASVPFHPVGMEPIPHDPVTLAKDELVHSEDKRRRDEARKHGTIPKVSD